MSFWNVSKAVVARAYADADVVAAAVRTRATRDLWGT